jgi:hypothetical protein
MSKNNMNDIEIKAINAELTDQIMKDLTTPIKQRKGFDFNSSTVTVPRYFYRIIGYKTTEDEYYDNLYSFNRQLSSFNGLYYKFDKGLNRNIDMNLQNKIDTIFTKCLVGGILDTSLLISYINDQGIMNNDIHNVSSLQIKGNFKGILDYYLSSMPNVVYADVKVLISYVFYWINLYVKNIYSKFSFDNVNPKILYYGNISKEEVFFLILLGSLGCDILYFNPESTGTFTEIDRVNAFSKEILYNNRSGIKAYPDSLRERVKTSAYNAREEINKTLFSEDSKFYRPWQFADYNIEAVTLKTTYEEINIWAKENAVMRDGWKIEGGTVFIPNIFAKVNGTHEDIEKYLKEINEIANQKIAKFYIDLPIHEVVPLEYGKLEQIYPSKYGREFDTEKLLKASWWKYKELRTGLQRNIAEKIKELCLNPIVKSSENVDLRDKQVDIFSVLINLDMKHLQILQGFDYPGEVPKIIIYNNEENGNISYEDSIMLLFMNAMGVDIIIYNPSGYNDIEEYLSEDVYDIHRMEKLSFNLKFRKPIEKKGFFKNLFK